MRRRQQGLLFGRGQPVNNPLQSTAIICPTSRILVTAHPVPETSTRPRAAIWSPVLLGRLEQACRCLGGHAKWNYSRIARTLSYTNQQGPERDVLSHSFLDYRHRNASLFIRVPQLLTALPTGTGNVTAMDAGDAFNAPSVMSVAARVAAFNQASRWRQRSQPAPWAQGSSVTYTCSVPTTQQELVW